MTNRTEKIYNLLIIKYFMEIRYGFDKPNFFIDEEKR